MDLTQSLTPCPLLLTSAGDAVRRVLADGLHDVSVSHDPLTSLLLLESLCGWEAGRGSEEALLLVGDVLLVRSQRRPARANPGR